jgi:oligoendopeptidase F
MNVRKHRKEKYRDSNSDHPAHSPAAKLTVQALTLKLHFFFNFYIWKFLSGDICAYVHAHNLSVNSKECGRKRSWPYLRYYCYTHGGIKKTIKNLSPYQGRDIKPGSH